MIIGVTGGFASGKSTVAGLIAQHGAMVLDADSIAHEYLQSGQEGYAHLIHVFGKNILSVDGAIDRRRLGQTGTRTEI